MKECMLTTYDNPYNPFKNFDEWFTFDVIHNYNCCGMLARMSYTSDALSEEENQSEIERAIDEIIRLDFLNIYKKVYNDKNTE